MRSPERGGFREAPEPERWKGPEKVYFPDEEGKMSEWGITFLAKDFVKLVKVGEGGKLRYMEVPREDAERAAKLSPVLEFIRKYDNKTEQDIFSHGAEKVKESVKRVIGFWPEFKNKKSIRIDSLLLEMEIEKVSEKIRQKEEQIDEIKEEMAKRGLWLNPAVGDFHALGEITEKKEKILDEIGELIKDRERLREASDIIRALEGIK